MTISNFDKRLLIEQIRYIEAEQTLTCDNEEVSHDPLIHLNFEDRLWQRALCLVDKHDLSSPLEHAARLSRYIKTFALIVAALLGMLGIVYAVTDSQTINIYWLLLLLLGFNLFSMLLWLTGIGLNMKGLIAGVLARLTGWLPDHLVGRSRDRTSTLADHAWLACNYGGSVGKWQFSKITHQLWLAYLLAGLVFLVLLLMLRQYDFVWGTTLLSDTAFIKLTENLSVPLEALGFTTPSVDQIHETRIGLAQVLTVEHRSSWAQFLLAALLCFGVIPRILLWSWSALMSAHARRHFTLDYYLPYYINLRQQLMPLASHGQIVDADTSPPVITEIDEETTSTTPVPHTLPDVTQWVAVELGNNLIWPPPYIATARNLGHVIDRESLTSTLQHIESNECPVIAVAVSAARPPDRGVQRVITSLMASSEQRWLILLQTDQNEPISSTRLAAWYRLAEVCNVPADHVIRMSGV